jgi:CheY-like chemotaxis protein
VDDHRDTVDMMQEYLEAVGATVFGADSAKAGLALAETHVLDAALVDLRMPRGWMVVAEPAARVADERRSDRGHIRDQCRAP